MEDLSTKLKQAQRLLSEVTLCLGDYPELAYNLNRAENLIVITGLKMPRNLLKYIPKE